MEIYLKLRHYFWYDRDVQYSITMLLDAFDGDKELFEYKDVLESTREIFLEQFSSWKRYLFYFTVRRYERVFDKWEKFLDENGLGMSN